AELAGRRHLHAALGDEDDLAPTVLQRARHDLFRVAGAVGRCGIHAVDAAIERTVDGLDGLVILDRTVAIAGHRPAAKTHHRPLHSGGADGGTTRGPPRRAIWARAPGARPGG